MTAPSPQSDAGYPWRALALWSEKRVKSESLPADPAHAAMSFCH
ncbi:hypothetical protein [Oxalicibacterium faecigallinarum]|nr:hypothetical protein [Oxalicibacterium faecigallinarum]